MLIQDFYELYWGRIEKIWTGIFKSEESHHSVNEIVLYHLKNPGKRLRSYLSTGLSNCLETGISERAMDFAASVELLHNASLIHDDLEDQDFYRRGELNIWKKYSPAQAINMGDLLFTKSLEIILSSGIPDDTILRLIGRMIAAINELIYGQMLEISFSGTINMTWIEWENIAAQKTGALFRLIFEGAFLISGADIGDYREELENAGRLIGILYQMRDDLLDAMGLKEGRPVGSDIIEGKMTCLSIKALEKDGKKAGIIRETLLNPGKGDVESRKRVLSDLYEELGILSELQKQFSCLLEECRENPLTRSFPRIKPVMNDFLDLLIIDNGKRGIL